MKIYSMTATFGKLEHETLSLTPGLNIIEAPNEWGKSTWCAFLVAMLYGIETRTKTTKTVLADKEKYAPWSGSPMAGRIDLCWNGRDITIERRSKGRTVFGDFRAYETATGLDVKELTGANCGQILLGVEKSVFTRAGFLRQSDLPVTEDESLRRRLNALVTTGDESGTADDLAQKLKELKNRCRHNRTGLLPQAQTELAELESKYRELVDLNLQQERLTQRQQEATQYQTELRNHRTALQYETAQEDANRVRQAMQAKELAAKHLEEAEAVCHQLPAREDTQRLCSRIRQLSDQWQSVQMEAQMLPEAPQPPVVSEAFSGLTPQEAAQQAHTAAQEYDTLRCKQEKTSLLPWILGGILLTGGIIALFLQFWLGWVLLALGAAALTIGIVRHRAVLRRRAQTQAQLQALAVQFGSANPEEWVRRAEDYATAQHRYEQEMQEYAQLRGDLDQRTASLRQQIDALSGNGSLSDRIRQLDSILAAWDTYETALRELQRADSYAATVQAMAKTVQKPDFPDSMTFTEAETARLLSDTDHELRQLQLRLGQCQGRMEVLGDENTLLRSIQALKTRIQKLEQMLAALELAQSTLAEAAAELQRRFAPRISARAQALFNRLTGSRYDRLTLGEDLSVSAGAQGEDTIRSSLWRSDGTVDQLYLALRLAVAEELTPNAPLILDDAFVRFDDTRLKTALDILCEEAQSRQVILFSCQSRERELSETQ